MAHDRLESSLKFRGGGASLNCPRPVQKTEMTTRHIEGAKSVTPFDILTTIVLISRTGGTFSNDLPQEEPQKFNVLCIEEKILETEGGARGTTMPSLSKRPTVPWYNRSNVVPRFSSLRTLEQELHVEQPSL